MRRRASDFPFLRAQVLRRLRKRLPRPEVKPADYIDDLKRRFGELHDLRYRHAFMDTPTEVVALQVEVVALHVEVFGRLPKPTLRVDSAGATPHADANRSVYFESRGYVDCRVVHRDSLSAGARLQGPMVIEEQASTTLVHPGDSVAVDRDGNLVIMVGA